MSHLVDWQADVIRQPGESAKAVVMLHSCSHYQGPAETVEMLWKRDRGIRDTRGGPRDDTREMCKQLAMIQSLREVIKYDHQFCTCEFVTRERTSNYELNCSARRLCYVTGNSKYACLRRAM